MLLKKLFTVSSLSLLLMQVGCGDKNAAEDVNIKSFDWAEKTDGKAILYKGSALSLTGDVEGNKPFVISFSITDSHGKEIKQDSTMLHVTHTPPQSGKKSLSLQDDMNPKVVAGYEVCNGQYTVNIIATSGQAVVKKPQHFEVRGGRDASFCQTKTGGGSGVSFTAAKISNRWGPDSSAFDLKAGANVGADQADTNKDLADLTLKSEMFHFRKTLGSKNGSKFVQVSLPRDASDADIQAAFANGMQRDETAILNSGDTVIVKSPRDFHSLYFLKIISAREDEASSNPGKHRTGAVRFEYRKVSSGNNT